MTGNMTRGPITRQILLYALPICFGSIFQQFYNLADTVIVGRFLGVNALAGVGCTTGITFLAYSLCNGLSNGFSVSVAQRLGAGDKKGMKQRFGNGVLLSALIAVILTILFVIFCRPVLNITNTPADIYGYAYEYILVFILGLPATVYYNFQAAHLRAIGDSRTPVIALVIASILNVGLDILFITAFGMGVTGAAFATVISELVSGIFLTVYIVKKVPDLQISRNYLHLCRSISWEQMATAVPMGIQGSVIAVGIMIVQTSINTMGTVYVAGSTAGNKLYGIMAAPVDAVCQAMIPLSGQNFGAKNYKRINAGLKRVMLITWSMTIVLSVIAWVFGKFMIGWFVDSTQEADVIRYGHQFLVSFVMGYGFLAIQESYCFTLQGIGQAKYTVMSGVLETLGRIAGAVLLTRWFGYTGICLALPLAWIFTSVYVLPIYYVRSRKIYGCEKGKSFTGKRYALCGFRE